MEMNRSVITVILVAFGLGAICFMYFANNSIRINPKNIFSYWVIGASVFTLSGVATFLSVSGEPDKRKRILRQINMPFYFLGGLGLCASNYAGRMPGISKESLLTFSSFSLSLMFAYSVIYSLITKETYCRTKYVSFKERRIYFYAINTICAFMAVVFALISFLK